MGLLYHNLNDYIPCPIRMEIDNDREIKALKEKIELYDMDDKRNQNINKIDYYLERIQARVNQIYSKYEK